MTPASQETFMQLWGTLRKSPGLGMPPELQKAINQATGLVWYDLEPYAKLLFPVITPLRNEIPRVKGDGGTSTHWVSIIGININSVSIGLGEGQRGGQVTTSVQQNLATYKSFGLDDSVTFEADLAAVNFDDVKRLAVDNLLRSVMIGEEKCIVGGNTSVQLGLTPTPTVTSPATTGGAFSNSTQSVICVALAFDAFFNAGGATAVATATNQIPAAVTRTNTDNSVITYGGGSAQKSANQTIGLVGGTATQTVAATVTAVKGAVGYAWFIGLAGSETLNQITTINSVLFTAASAAGTQTAASLPTSDNSTNALLFDGLVSIICGSPGGNASNSFFLQQATGTAGTGTPLTADGAGGVKEIDTALKAFWDSYRLSPQVILANSQEILNITNKVVSGGGTPVFRFLLDQQNPTSAASLAINAGTVVGTYLNKYTMAGGQLIQVLLHPNIPAGTLIFYSRLLPYPLSNVKNLLQMKLRRDYFQIEWPQVRPQYEYSVWANGVLQCFFPPAFGMITNIANG